MMRIMACMLTLCLAATGGARAQSAANMIALQGLMPVTVLGNTAEGKAALAANYTTTGAIQDGSARQPTLLPFADQQEQALRDAFITGRNAEQLADGLGTRLGAAYRSKARYTGPSTFTSLSQEVVDLITYSGTVTASDSGIAKYDLGDGTLNGTVPVSPAAGDLLKTIGGVTDIFGIAYGHPAGSPGSDPYGNARPFQTLKSLTLFQGNDFFGTPADSVVYLRGPVQNLTDNPSFPSGHTTYGYMDSLLLGILIPQRYQQQVVRGAEYGNDRIILGAHYAMDVLGGRTLALHDLAQLLANNPTYLGQTLRGVTPITDYQAAVKAARESLIAVLEPVCGTGIAVCARQDTGRFSNADANKAFYDSTQTYGLPVVYPSTAATTEDVAKRAPEAGYLLTAAFPFLTLDQADAILTETEGPGGGFLDNGSAFGLYSRLDLFKAAGQVMTLPGARLPTQ